MKGLIVTLLALTLLACEPVSTYEPSVRPDNVPTSALWVGGPDGGVYAKISESKGSYSGTIYFDSTGEVWYEGSFTYTGQDKFDVTEGSSYSAWDGDILYLVNGQQLISSSAEKM